MDYYIVKRTLNSYHNVIRTHNKTVGSIIKHHRKEKNLTQEQLAEKLGVSNKTISKWENGKCMPDYSVVKSQCEELIRLQSLLA